VINCYEANNCTPTASCATSNDGTCGVNTVGVDVASQTTANGVYTCAACTCP
jgi:hypothetical protein